MPITRVLRVYPNPYLGLDEEGRPCATVQVEPHPVLKSAGLRHIGATLIARTIRPAEERGNVPSLDEHTWEFSTEPQVVESSVYYNGMVRSGQLIAADLETWTTAGGDPREFQDPKAELARCKAVAIAEYRAAYGHEPAAIVAHWAEFLGASSAPRKRPDVTESK